MPETRTLPCHLTEDEVAVRAAEMANLIDLAGKIEVEKKIAMDEFKERAATTDGRIRLLARQVRERAEQREVEIDHRSDDVRCVVETFRCDTGEIVGSRPMTQDEVKEARQAALPGIGKRRRQN